jgi:hypothetical protein
MLGSHQLPALGLTFFSIIPSDLVSRHHGYLITTGVLSPVPRTRREQTESIFTSILAYGSLM